MAYAYDRTLVDGTDYDVTFPYIDKSHVKVFVEVDRILTPVTFTWINPTRIRLDAEPAAGSYVIRQRQTSPNERLVDYSVPSSLSEEDLDNDSLQAFYRTQEADDLSEIAKDLTETYINAIRPYPSENTFNPFLPNVATRQGMVLGFDAEGQMKMVDLSLNTLIVSGFVQDTLDDQNAGEFMSSLGISAYFQNLVPSPNLDTLLDAMLVSNDVKSLMLSLDATAMRGVLSVPSTAITITGQHSISGGGSLAANRSMTLVGDVASPGNYMVYGTNATGTRGWRSQYTDAPPGTIIGFGHSVKIGYDATFTTTLPVDAGVPQQSVHGKKVLEITYTPKKANSLLRITTHMWGATSHPQSTPSFAYFVDNVEAAWEAELGNDTRDNSGNGQWSYTGVFVIPAGSTTARTYKVHVGGTGPGMTIFLNGGAGAPFFGGLGRSVMYVEEIAQ